MNKFLIQYMISGWALILIGIITGKTSAFVGAIILFTIGFSNDLTQTKNAKEKK